MGVTLTGVAAVGLLFVGAVLFVNALLLLGVVDAKSAALFNLFVGTLQVIVPTYLIITAEAPDEILFASGIYLFGFTYLYVGLTNLTNFSPRGLGWYCLWVAFIAGAFAMVNFFRLDDPKFGIIWLNWLVLWGLFWLVLGLGREQLTRFTGWTTLVMSFTTCTVPAYLLLLGWWEDVPTWVYVVVAGATLAVMLAAARTIERQPAPPIPPERAAAA
jgi:hypothetical protein